MKPILFDDTLFSELSETANTSSRKRANRNIHNDYQDVVQRLFITLLPDSYVRPHKHTQMEKWEFFLMVSGKVSFLLFNDDGVCTERHELSATGNIKGLEIPANCWHCVVPSDEEATFFEVKQGPYIQVDDKGFAQWSPCEGDAGAANFLSRLKTLKQGQSAREQDL